MNLEAIRDFCLIQRGVTESFPFDETTLVFKVMGKMFALLNLEAPFSINLKCDPEEAVSLREQYDFVLPGYHMNKQQWNTVMLVQELDASMLKHWIMNSYDLIVAKLPRKEKEKLAAMNP